MKKLKYLVVLSLMLFGLSSMAQAKECYKVVNVPVAKVNKVYETYTKKVPYTVYQEVCEPIRDSCNNIIRYVKKKIPVTKYKYVTVKKFKGYEHIGYYNGGVVRLIWPTKRCTIPAKVPTDCCEVTVVKEPVCNLSCNVN